MNSAACILRVDRREIVYISWILESYDGAALVRTLDPRQALIEVLIAPGCESLVSGILQSLIEKEALGIEFASEMCHNTLPSTSHDE
ncbi:MAG: DUF4911 domain-containing protein [Deltaproteobacteria bacterium]|nr:DUF4911 domain-containing protein [Deltaproteobacteria bacterium]